MNAIKIYSDEGRKINPQIITLCHSVARRKGYGRATSIVFSQNKRDLRPRVDEKNSSQWFYTTRGGEIINHPVAYMKRGFSNMIYHRAHCTVILPKFYQK